MLSEISQAHENIASSHSHVKAKEENRMRVTRTWKRHERKDRWGEDD